MIKKHKNKIIVIALMVLGTSLILFSSFKSKISVKNDNEISEAEYVKALEEKLEKFLLSVDGIHNVNVIITLDTSREKVYEGNNSSISLIGNSTQNGQQDASVEIYPYVRGVAVSCTNGENDYVKNKLTRLISAYLGIPTNRIEIVSYG